jgi:hypothetical protein
VLIRSALALSNVCIPYENRPNRGRRMRTYPVVERNESVYIWNDVNRWHRGAAGSG